MVRKTTLFALFLVSYIPLFFIVAIQNLNDTFLDESGTALSVRQILLNNTLPILLTSISILSFGFYLLFIKINASAGFRNPKKITRIKNTGVEYLSYLATYIIPFLVLLLTSDIE